MSRLRYRRQFDLVELVASVFFVSLCACLFVGLRAREPSQATGLPVQFVEPDTLREAARLEASYGPTHYSQFREEWIIRDFFKDKRGGFFVDVGASHYRDNSNTFYLESGLGWSGIAVEPQAAFEADYWRYRPRTRFFAFFVSNASNQSATLFIADQDSLDASGNPDLARQTGRHVTESIVPTVALTDLLTRLHVGRIDLLSVDVELSEPKVLAGFDIDRFRPTLVCIEAHAEVRQEILDFFARHGYTAVGRYLRLDTLNLYFTPLGPEK